MKIPKLNPGHKVYVIYNGSIFLKSAAYIGKYSFIVDRYEWLNEDAREYDYNDYGITWFTSIAEAKKFLLEAYDAYDRKGKVVQLAVDYWEFKEDNK